MKLTAQYIARDYAKFPMVTTELNLDPKKLTFLIVDAQNDFLSTQGFFAGMHANMTECRKMIPPTKRVVEACRKAGVQVIYTTHVYRPSLCDVGKQWRKIKMDRPGIGPGTKIGPPGQKLGSLIKGTWNTAIVDELTPQDSDIIIDDKHQHSGFYQTDLEHILHTLDIETIMFAGVTTSICVESTVRDAYFRDFGCIMLSDCTCDILPEYKSVSERLVMTNFGTVTSSEEVIKALAAA